MDLRVELRIKCRVFVGHNYLTVERNKHAIELADFMDDSLYPVLGDISQDLKFDRLTKDIIYKTPYHRYIALQIIAHSKVSIRA
jgi:hypothetical protein